MKTHLRRESCPRAAPSRSALLASLVAVAAILAATLYPAETSPGGDSGSRPVNLADVLRNLVLFGPLGASLAWARVGPARALLVGAALSGAIELLQIAIPGRMPQFRDVFANAAGTGIGVALFRTAPEWIDAAEPQAVRLAVAAAALATAAFSATGLLLAPAPAGERWFSHWNPDLGHLSPYGGAILSVSIGELELPHGWIADADRVGKLLRGDYELRVDAIAGPPPLGQAAFFLITSNERENLLLGPDREDLVYRYRTRGWSLGLEPARLRFRSALRGIRPGQPLQLRIRRSAGDLCLYLNGVRDCGQGLTVGDGWQLLAPEFRWLAPLRPALAAIWVAALCFPLGYWGRPRVAVGVAWALAAGALVMAPAATGMLDTPGSQFLGCASGVAVGALARRMFRGFGDPRATDSTHPSTATRR